MTFKNQKHFGDRRLSVSVSLLMLESCSAKASMILKSLLHSLQGQPKSLLIFKSHRISC